MKITAWLGLFVLMAVIIGVSAPLQTGAENPLLRSAGNSSAASEQVTPVQVAMKNVMYHFSSHVAVHILQLQGTMTSLKPGAIVVFDDKNSFTLNMASAEIAISCSALAQVMNENVFSAADAPLKKLDVTSKDNHLVIKGQLHSKGDVPFEVTGGLSATGDGRIRFHAEHVKAAHLPVKGLLDLMGVSLANLINTKKVQGVSVDKDDLILNAQEILPPPQIRGNVTAVRLQGNDIVQTFGTPPVANFAAKQTGNYMAYRDGDLRFGKLTMNQADLILLDMDPQDPFDFFLDHYRDQLVAGYTKTTPDFGLRVYTRDYNKLQGRHAASASR